MAALTINTPPRRLGARGSNRVRGKDPMTTTTTAATDPAASLIDPPISTAVAISYLRVSTREQASKGGTDEVLLHPRSTRRGAPQSRPARRGDRGGVQIGRAHV